ncbi:MAG: hypothetical protein GXY61_00080 [Lentisphaerae bacterium]|nr:hypothetical protein [Lentisphaerota bacterium]
MDGITKIIDWMGKCAPSKLFWSIVLVVYSLLLFEQYTDHFRLTRLAKAAALVESVSPGIAQMELRDQLTAESQGLLQPKKASPWWLRVICGAAPFILLQIAQLFNDRNIWGILKMCLIICLGGGLIALIPDFFPKWYQCFGASLVYVWGIMLSIQDDLRKPIR